MAILALLLKRTRLLNFSYHSFTLHPPQHLENAMMEAAKVKNIKIMKLLMERGISKSIAEGGFIYAVSINELELVKEFVKYGVDVNCNSYYLKNIPILSDEPIFSRAKAILIAIKNGNGAIVEYLLRKNVDIVVRSGIGAVRNFSPLGYAFEMKNSEIIKMMINLSSKSKYSGFHDWCCGKSETILMLAIKNCPELVSFVLSKGENVNIANENSETALMRASEYNRINAVKLLISAGARVNVKDNSGNSPLSIAKSKNHSEIVKLLVAAGARE
jgi:ankyrin repeat protein